jgi:DNA polymerase III subunit epsilon
MFASPLVVIDFETSGMSPEQGGRITEVAALRIVGDRVTERFVSLVNCGVRIPSFITQLTGITQRMVDRAPLVDEVLPRLLEFIGSDALVAHNASFDEKFLMAEAARISLASQHHATICSVKLSRRVIPGLASYSLGSLASSLDIQFNSQAHRAEADADVTARLMLRLGTELKAKFSMPEVDTAMLVAINRNSAAKFEEIVQKKLQPRSPTKTTYGKRISISLLTEKAAPKLYRHYKGGLYELVCEATQESDLTPQVVYKASDGSFWTRPRSVFFEMLVIDGKQVQRFCAIDE